MADRISSVRGVDDVVNALIQAGLTTNKQKNIVLKAAAESARSDAEVLAVARIPRIGYKWSRMRVGVTKRAVYVAPKSRGTKLLSQKRPNLGDRLLHESMIPAVRRNEANVARRLEELLVKVEREFKSGT